MSMARLWRDQAKREEARETSRRSMAGSRSIKEPKALLEELAA
jgi:hypothetical protein